jgi:hypothetical protein
MIANFFGGGIGYQRKVGMGNGMDGMDGKGI